MENAEGGLLISEHDAVDARHPPGNHHHFRADAGTSGLEEESRTSNTEGGEENDDPTSPGSYEGRDEEFPNEEAFEHRTSNVQH
jgi:hypothetical protein